MSPSLTFILFILLVLMLLGLGLTLLYLRKTSVEDADGDYYQSNKGPLYYKVVGEKGPWVVMLHGLGGSSYGWRHITPELSKKFRVLTLDLWGFGHSSKDLDAPMTLDQQSLLITDLIDSLNIKQYHLVGHSMGAEIALWIQKNDDRAQTCVCITPAVHPKLVSRVLSRFAWIANWTPYLLTPKTIRRLLLSLLKDPSLITEEMIEYYHAPYLDHRSHLSFAAALDIVRDPRVFDLLPDLGGEIIVLWGQKDQVINKKIRSEIMERMQQARHITHPWSGHLPMEDDHTWVTEQLFIYLKV